MAKTSLIDKLKNRWGINSSWQILIVFIVFGLTGYSSLYVKQFFYYLFNITESDTFWLRALVWILLVFPAYQVLLLFFGTLFGQFKFFWKFEKKMLRRFGFEFEPSKAD